MFFTQSTRYITLFILLGLTTASQASYYDAEQNLEFHALSSELTPNANWRIATGTEVYALFYGQQVNYDQPALFRQQTADAILALGGTVNSGEVSCGGQDCEAIITACNQLPFLPECETLVVTGGEYILPGLAYDEEGLAGNYLSLYEISGSYSDLDGDGLWVNNLISPAAALDYQCEFTDCSNLNGPVAYVNEVPVPAAAWLFGSALLSLVALKRNQ
ncbi:hypothetical protein [Oceanicoccus sagamiensis]|uniref:Uncharacterized protein n=1 Tax=Oceanicoccus sagamiensis TaxID=716816 RepID=A0A1X9NFZ1_9GAMM|nr:hypothetical protein [Oceanicoccus sagamiensis]ARN72923.1 hypothetical protein BST96_01660 [Oceanicoccus sagamiensis]